MSNKNFSSLLYFWVLDPPGQNVLPVEELHRVDEGGVAAVDQRLVGEGRQEAGVETYEL